MKSDFTNIDDDRYIALEDIDICHGKMNRMTATRLRQFMLVFFVVLFGHCEGQYCNSPPSTLIRVRWFLMFRRTRNCGWVSGDLSRCNLMNYNTYQGVSLTCGMQCWQVSGCQDQSSFPPYPSGPYVTVSKSSEIVTIPRPPLPNLKNDPSSCPHVATGLKRWHDTATWNGAIPSDGQDVTIPSSTRVLIDQTITQRLGLVTVPSTSELIIGTNANGISINATGFMVSGKLTAGSENCRIATPITITLHGSRPNTAPAVLPASTYKAIFVSGNGSALNIHGQRYYQTWTRLAQSVEIGQQVLLLQENVNWSIGQKIVLVTSAMKDSRDFNQNEILTITNINYSPPNGLGAIVYVAEPVQYRHIANNLYQVEVGLLSRTIKVQGAENDSEPTDPDPLNGSCMDPWSVNNWMIYYNTTQPCMNKNLMGFGGHIRIENGGIGQVEGVELYRMGQTNILGRYPIHFHLLGNCPTCYFRHSSIHRSFYRCISIHGTHNTTTSENVAFDVIGYCYYLEDGVEKDNTISYNLAAHIHTIGPDIPRGFGQTTSTYAQTDNLTLPADVTASGYYITNIHNKVIGNAASGGWAGFAFPNLLTPLQTFRNSGYHPNFETSLQLDGNTAHSTGWWWSHAGSFYFGGDLYYDSNNVLVYNPGRGSIGRSPCLIDPCQPTDVTCPTWKCGNNQKSWLRITNTKTFLNAGVGLNSWTGRIEVIGYEAHDSGLAIEALSEGFWLDQSLAVCRTNESLGFQRAKSLTGNGFVWYDTWQTHIITNATFRNCGYRSDLFNQYDTSPSRGCGDDPQSGCQSSSSVFGFLTHSDQFTPQIMQATKSIKFQDCGRRFRLSMETLDSVSGRAQNWLDTDGSVSGLGVPTLIGSGLWSSKNWWGVDSKVVYDPQAPLRFIRKNDGPKRNIGYVNVRWDDSLRNQSGSTLCGNGNGLPCPWYGFIRHAGKMFAPNNNTVNNGLPITAGGDIAGPTGGYGWIVNFNQTAPRFIKFENAEIDPTSLLVISIPYPINTTFTITATSGGGCWQDASYNCTEVFQPASSFDEVRLGSGNKYYVDQNGVVTFRIVQTTNRFTGNPNWTIPNYNTPPRRPEDVWALPRFNRSGVVLPQVVSGTNYFLQAKCPSDTNGSATTGYCPEPVFSSYDPDVCPEGYVQTAYDACCQSSNTAKCIYSDGSRNF